MNLKKERERERQTDIREVVVVLALPSLVTSGVGQQEGTQSSQLHHVLPLPPALPAAPVQRAGGMEVWSVLMRETFLGSFEQKFLRAVVEFLLIKLLCDSFG